MEPMKLPGGIEFYSFRDSRFKQGALSIQFVRPMKKEEAALNALLPAVLLRGTKDCPDLRTITLRLDTTLPRTYSRGLAVHGTRAYYQEEGDFVFEDDGGKGFHVARPLWGNAEKYEDRYLPDFWKEEVKGGHGGMDYQMLRDFYARLARGEAFPIDVYDAAAWMSISYLSKQSIAGGNIPVEIPDFTNGRWMKQD